MLGAVAGDIIGSPFERANTYKEDFPMLRSVAGEYHGRRVVTHPSFTDATVMTIAVSRWLTGDAEAQGRSLVRSILEMADRFPNAGYGMSFRRWLESEYHRPSYNYGNMAAARVSPVGLFVKDLGDVMRIAAVSAEVTHNHPDAVKGAQAVAQAVWMARNGRSRDDIRFTMVHDFAFNLDMPLDDLRALLRGCISEPIIVNGEETGETFFRETGRIDSSSNLTVTAAIRAFLETEDFEKAVRRAISLGGDSSSIASICGAIAAPFYGGVPEELSSKCENRLDSGLRDAMRAFENALGNNRKIAVESPKEHRVIDSFKVIRREGQMPVFVIEKGADHIAKAVREKFGQDSLIIPPGKLNSYLNHVRENDRDGTFVESPRPDIRVLMVQDGVIRGPLSYSGPNAVSIEERTAFASSMHEILQYASEVKAELQRRSGYLGDGSVRYATAYFPVIYRNAIEIYQGPYLDGKIVWDEYNAKVHIDQFGELHDGEYREGDIYREKVFCPNGPLGTAEIKAAIGRFCLDEGVGVGDNRKSNIDAAIDDICNSKDERLDEVRGPSNTVSYSSRHKM